MTITTKARGMTVPAYIEFLVASQDDFEQQLESLAIEGIQSGHPIEAGPEFWEEMHPRLRRGQNQNSG